MSDESKTDQGMLSVDELIDEVDAQFWKAHPEFVGKKLTGSLEDTAARVAWSNILVRRLSNKVFAKANKGVAQRTVRTR